MRDYLPAIGSALLAFVLGCVAAWPILRRALRRERDAIAREVRAADLLATAAGHEIETRVALSEGYAFREGCYRMAGPPALAFAPPVAHAVGSRPDAPLLTLRPGGDTLPSSGVVVALPVAVERDTAPGGEPWPDESGERPCVLPGELVPLRIPALAPLERVDPSTPKEPRS